MTALMVASREDQREAVRSLLHLGADPDLRPQRGGGGGGSNGGGAGGRSACDIAEGAGLQEVYGLLMQHSIVAAAGSALEASEQRQKVGVGRGCLCGGAQQWQDHGGEELGGRPCPGGKQRQRLAGGV